ncbi:MAG: ribosome-associated translation inhibitor RaiA [Candidatus Omnitrophica bacterium]|nr:ribosome-associated translation inhibitor RaiA [Candidatus Omnitrophota bacterium]
MDIRFSGQNLKITEGMKTHVEERLPKLEQYAPHIVEAHVFLKKEKYLYRAEVTLLAKNFRAFGEGANKENIFTAFDEAYARVEKQLKKYRAKTKDHRKKGSQASAKIERAMRWVEAETAVPPLKPRIIKVKGQDAKPMSVEEAGLQLGVLPDIFLFFLNQETNKINVIYKRKDGDYGLIEPSF